jgi:glycosyltransferase involved in cell wall biosynthesis
VGAYRVLHVTQPVTEGVAQCVRHLVTDQLEAGWHVEVACPAAPWDSPLAGLPRRRWEARRAPGPHLAAEVWALRRVIAEFDPALVHLHSSKAGLVGRLVLRGRRATVFQPHAWSFEAVTGATRDAAWTWERAALRWTDRVVCVSHAEQAIAVALGADGGAVTIPNGVDLTAAPRAGEGAAATARERLGLVQAPTVVCLGRLCRQKGQDVLLAAWPEVRSRVPDAQLVLVGDGEDRDRLQRRADHVGARLAGGTSDPWTWLAAADVVAVPSRWEGMALVVLEAMATGRSIVATDVGGARECVLPGTGSLVPSQDASALATSLVQRLEDPVLAAREGISARATAERLFDLRRTTAEFRGLYAELLAAGHPRTP